MFSFLILQPEMRKGFIMKTIIDRTKLRNIELRNRIFRSATWMAMADEGGYINDAIINFYHCISPIAA